MAGNYGVTSPYYYHQDLEEFVSMLRVGDLIEFDRGIYSHWAVYYGISEFQMEVAPCVVHRSNDDDDEDMAALTFLLTSSSSSYTNHRIGRCCLESLKHVMGSSPARINNSLDKIKEPLDKGEIVDRLKEEILFVKKYGRSKMSYSLTTNNCEHFAKWARNDMRKSEQVQNAMIMAGVGASVALGAMAIGSILNSREDNKKSRQRDF